MPKTLKEIAEVIGAEVAGNSDTVITGVAGIEDAREGDITFIANSKYLPFLSTTRASAVIVGRDMPYSAAAKLFCAWIIRLWHSRR